MDPTTLFTFLFTSPPAVKTVELLGSWDNFQMSYRMHHDRSRGSNFWTGCFKFENIIFDGLEMQWAKPRTGGLRQGGTYWYYYRLNYKIDAYNGQLPHTTICPLLYGQPVNILEVPTELLEPPTRCHSDFGYDITGTLSKHAERKTLDPANKNAAIEPPPLSKAHARCLSDDQLKGRMNIQPPIMVKRAVLPVATSQSDRVRAESAPIRPQSSAVSSTYSDLSSQNIPNAFGGMDGPEMLPEVLPPRPLETTGQLSHSDRPDLLSDAPIGSLEAIGAVLYAPPKKRSPVGAVGSSGTTSSQPAERRRDSTFSCGPASIQNVQFYGSRPGTSLWADEVPYQPRTYSIPISDLSDGSPAVSPTSPHFSTLEDHNCMNHNGGKKLGSEPSDDESRAPKLTTPIITVTTASNGGHDSTFRLSDHFSNEDSDWEHDLCTDKFERSSPLTMPSRNEIVSSGRPRLLERGLARFIPRFSFNYSLPSLSTDSTHSIAKTFTQDSARNSCEGLQLPLPPIGLEEGSIADAIFDDLGFLSISID